MSKYDEFDIVNLTPHEINIYSDDSVFTVPPSGSVARVDVRQVKRGRIGPINVFESTYGRVVGLPDPAPDTVFIVSAMVRQAASERADLYSPGDLVRNDKGQPVGCNGLIGNF